MAGITCLLKTPISIVAFELRIKKFRKIKAASVSHRIWSLRTMSGQSLGARWTGGPTDWICAAWVRNIATSNMLTSIPENSLLCCGTVEPTVAVLLKWTPLLIDGSRQCDLTAFVFFHKSRARTISGKANLVSSEIILKREGILGCPISANAILMPNSVG